MSNINEDSCSLSLLFGMKLGEYTWKEKSTRNGKEERQNAKRGDR